MSNEGKQVTVHYVGTLDDGTKFDSSRDRDEPLVFTCMAGQMIKGFDAAVNNMQVGDVIDVHIPAAEAYGEHNPNMVITFPAEQVPNIEQLSAGDRIMLQAPNGMPIPATITEVASDHVTVDANHEMAGKDLNFNIELLKIED